MVKEGVVRDVPALRVGFGRVRGDAPSASVVFGEDEMRLLVRDDALFQGKGQQPCADHKCKQQNSQNQALTDW